MDPALLHDLVLFQGLTEERMAWCASLFEVIEVPHGESILGRGDFAHTFFVVLVGEIEVLHDLEPVAVLGESEFWYRPRTEDSDDRRSVVAIATKDCHIARLTPWDFRSLRESLPIIGDRIDDTLEIRLRSTQTEKRR